jgi:hypothetical protein
VWSYSDVGDGTCEASMSLVTNLTRWPKIEISTGGVEYYGTRGSKGIDGCPLTLDQSWTRGNIILFT